MDTVIEEPEAKTPLRMTPMSDPSDVAAFDYVPVPISATVGLVLSVLGLFSLLTVLTVPVSLFGFLVSAAALWTIARSEGAYGGRKLAITGLVLGLVGFVGGIAAEVYAYRTEVPEQYTRTSFQYDVSDPGVQKGVAPNGQPGVAIPKSVQDLVGKEVFIKGYMYPDPDNRTQGIESFLLVKDLGDCCFGGEPAITDMIGVEFPLDEDLRATFYEQTKVGVGGTFKIREDYAFGPNEPIYEIEATHFALSKSSF